ncbi:MAG: hypothetical protein A2X02_00050 [Bacteroidetes bacterium GWF2_29_10]|nr:MAG: hypothetical protein A2X02_00050 [Bacteroidetes bacterium GWF2_29_10]
MILTFLVSIQCGNLNALYSKEFKNNTTPLYNKCEENKSLPRDDEYNNKITHIQNSLDNIVKKYRLNGNILISVHNNVVYEKTQGFANFKTKDSLNINTSFQLASTSKTFTAMSVMILKEKGLLKYDDLVVKYIKDFPYNTITIRHLLTHTSGLSNYIWNVEKYLPSKKSVTNDVVLDLYKKKRFNLIFKPGSRFDYCNTNYCFLALLVEKVSGTAFSNFLEKNIFVPLNMKNTFTYDKIKPNDNRDRALGYTKYRRGGYVPYGEDVVDRVLGDKGIFSTVEDLYKWDQALYSNRLVSFYTLNEAFEKGTLSNNNHFNYGYGFRLREVNDKKIVYHNGWWKGFKSGFTRLIEDQCTIIILNNTNAKLGVMIVEIEKLLQNSF